DLDEDEQDGSTQEWNENTKIKRRKNQVNLDFDDETRADISMISIPFKALVYIMGEISFVGRVTDINETGQDGEEEEEKQKEEEQEKQIEDEDEYDGEEEKEKEL
ncbi:MAG: hypothetical protein EZS28_034542, partial [Streblomastix strix]